MAIKTSIRVISMTTDTQRRALFSEAARLSQVEWSFYDANTSLAPQLSYKPRNSLVAMGRELRRGELGCYSSHYSLWLELARSDVDQMIVMEDDVLVDWAYINYLCSHDFGADGIPFLRLASLALPKSTNRGEYLGRYLVHFIGYALGTQAYLVTRQGVDHLLKYARVVRAPIDIALDRTWWGAPPNLAIYPHPVVERYGESGIGHARNAAHPDLSPVLRFSRFSFRVQDQVRLRFYRARIALGPGPDVPADSRWV